jgi:molybdate transport system ATP-binding protein
VCFEVAVKLRRGDAQVAVHFAGLGRLTALWGRSGVGKSSVLDMVAGLLRPDEGRIVVDGRVLFDSAEGIDLPPHARGCGYVFQDRRLFPHLSVERNLMYGWHLSRPDDALDRARAGA